MENNQNEELNKTFQLQKQVEALETLIKKYLDKNAITRYGNIKAAHPEKAMQVLAILAQLIQQGQIKQPISDDEFKALLMQLTQEKKQTKIAFR